MSSRPRRIRLAIAIAVTATIVRLLYSCRPVTFAIWTAATTVTHREAKIVVTFEELFLVALIFRTVYFLVQQFRLK